MNRPRPARLVSMLALTSLFLLAFSGLVLAQSQTEDAYVVTGLAEPDRNLDLLDLVGDPLQTVALRHGQATPFQVRVTDTSIDLLHADAPFQVQATMNNLYRVLEFDDGRPVVDSEGDRITSDKIELGYALSNALGARDVLADLNPRYLVGAVGGITCDDVAAALGTTVAALLSAGDPICGLLLDLTTGLPLVGADEELTVAGVEVATVLTLTEDLLDAAWAAVDGLPMGLTTPDTGTFDNPNCTTGLGAGDSRCTGSVPTALRMLQGQPLSLAALLDQVSQLVGDVVTLVGGEDAAALVDEVIAALNAAGGDAADLAAALESYTPEQRVDLINALLDDIALASPLELGDLLLSGQYRSLPTLKVDTTGAPGGQYAGTLTVSLFEGEL
jgi:hypothetical protein